MIPKRYVIKARGYDPVTRYQTLKAAERVVREWVKYDLVTCRKKFGTAITTKFGRCWQVSVSKQFHSPMWSRYTIHEV